jgi:hypothetical protein
MRSLNTFRTVGMHAGINSCVLDAMAGHPPKSVGDSYGEVSLKDKAAVAQIVAAQHSVVKLLAPASNESRERLGAVG